MDRHRADIARKKEEKERIEGERYIREQQEREEQDNKRKDDIAKRRAKLQEEADAWEAERAKKKEERKRREEEEERERERAKAGEREKADALAQKVGGRGGADAVLRRTMTRLTTSLMSAKYKESVRMRRKRFKLRITRRGDRSLLSPLFSFLLSNPHPNRKPKRSDIEKKRKQRRERRRQRRG